MGNLQEKAKEIRQKVVDYHFDTKTTHVGGSLSCVDLLTVLYYDIKKPGDSFVLSKGHCTSPLYVILHDLGLIPKEKFHSLEEHPTLNPEYGIQATTGSLGHGLSISLGMALARKDKKSFVLLSDGETDEGQIWEAARLASSLKLSNLVAIVDCNGWQAFKKADYFDLDKKFIAFGWRAVWCEGHNVSEIQEALSQKTDKPLVILAKTIKGKGIPEIENSLESHYCKLEKRHTIQ